MEPMEIVGKSKEDVSLPKAVSLIMGKKIDGDVSSGILARESIVLLDVPYEATMFKIIKEMLPPDVRVARDAQDLLVECCVEFINLISSESNEVCSQEEKRTIAPEHVLKALEVLGFGEYIEEVYAAYEQHRLDTLDSPKGGKWGSRAEMTEEEALAEQQRMFAEARARMNGTAIPKHQDPDRSNEQPKQEAHGKMNTMAMQKHEDAVQSIEQRSVFTEAPAARMALPKPERT